MDRATSKLPFYCGNWKFDLLTRAIGIPGLPDLVAQYAKQRAGVLKSGS
jgi:hypothetical protein